MTDCDILVSCAELKKQMDAGVPNLILLDVSWYSAKDAKEEFNKEHIPGATYLDVFDGAELTSVYPRNITTAEVFQKNARAVGVNGSSHVIVYSTTDNFGFFMSGRAWWMFKYYGHTNVSILDGGLAKWEACGYSKSAEILEKTEGDFIANVTPCLRKTYEEMRGNLSSKSLQVFDSRPLSAYAGETGGHIPGARNIPFSNLTNKDTGTLKSRDELLQVLAAVGVNLNIPMVTYCFSGMSSCSLAMAALYCGAKQVAVYNYGMTEWKAKSPVEDIEK